MMVKTRYFVIVSLLVVVVGLGTGLVAYYAGFPANAFFTDNAPDELRYMPSSASVVAYVEVREIMASDLRRQVHERFAPKVHEGDRQEFQELTGINYETDIERIVACFDGGPGSSNNSGLILARGLFDTVKIEALMREHGAQAQDYKGKRLIVAEHFGPNDFNHFDPPQPPAENSSFALTFMEPGLVAFGGTALVQHAIDLHTGGGGSAATNEELVAHLRGLQGGNAWIMGRMDLLRERAKLPEFVASQIPPITWFSIRGHIDGGLQAVVTAEARDDESATMLRDVVRGFLALAKLQTTSKPEFQRFVQSLQLGGNGKTVSLAVDVPAQVFDALSTVMPKQPAPKQPDPDAQK
jgi:hypothetical protein